MKFQRRVALLIVALLACTAVLLGACVPNEAPDDRKLVSLNPSEDDVSEFDSDFLAENEYITINDVVSVTPTNVAWTADALVRELHRERQEFLQEMSRKR